MNKVYVYVMNTMADWELGFVMAELNSKRFFKKDAKEIELKTVAVTKNPVKSMGGLTITPDLTIDEIEINEKNALLLPGSDTWAEPENMKIIQITKEFLASGGLVSAICGATVALGNAGILDDKAHTSNGAGFLDMFCPEYKGAPHFQDVPAIRDGNLITAGCTGALEMTKLILEYLDVLGNDKLDHWYKYFSTGDAAEFFALMQG